MTNLAKDQVTDEMVEAAHDAFRTSPPDEDGFPGYSRAMRAAIEAALATLPSDKRIITVRRIGQER